MDPKMVSEFNPQNGSKNGTQKEDKKSNRSAIFGLHFGGQILTPFLGSFFNLHFEV